MSPVSRTKSMCLNPRFDGAFLNSNGQGQPLGKKAAYGEEYNSIYTPKVLRGGCTSIVVYSATARAAL